MTDHETPAGRTARGWKRWLWLGWPLSFFGLAGTAFGFHSDAVAAKKEWLFWIVVCLAAAFYVVAAVVYGIRLIRWLWRRWAEFAKKARDHDGVQSDLAHWKEVAGKVTARADDAEERLKSWHRDTLIEGRRRVLAEIQASLGGTTFSDIEIHADGETLVIGAKWVGDPPEIDTRYLLRSRTLKSTKAVLETDALLEDATVAFRVAAVVSENYRISLLSRGEASGSILSDVEVVPRATNFEEEPVWPEN